MAACTPCGTVTLTETFLVTASVSVPVASQYSSLWSSKCRNDPRTSYSITYVAVGLLTVWFGEPIFNCRLWSRSLFVLFTVSVNSALSPDGLDTRTFEMS